MRRKAGAVTDQEWLFAYEWVKRGDILKALDVAYPKSSSRTKARKHWIAKKIAGRPAVKAEVNRIRADLRASERLTLEQHMTHLADIRDDAKSAGQFAAAARAEELRGKAAGFYIERHVHVELPQSRDEIRSRLQMLIQDNPRLKELVEMNVKQIESNVSVPSSSNEVSSGSEEPVVLRAVEDF